MVFLVDADILCWKSGRMGNGASGTQGVDPKAARPGTGPMTGLRMEFGHFPLFNVAGRHWFQTLVIEFPRTSETCVQKERCVGVLPNAFQPGFTRESAERFRVALIHRGVFESVVGVKAGPKIREPSVPARTGPPRGGEPNGGVGFVKGRIVHQGKVLGARHSGFKFQEIPGIVPFQACDPFPPKAKE